ncbi:dihydrolipoamide acetyltransferase family protein [Marinobacterium jannaschii]|uniref:dihydrolipoamide acetyltransferase family protein n=1 Tax=Marinobacterium jannaschii TaxID=64970 RepID=UPI00047FB525|nr:dihydrolipoamide acetyltransferase family protein [Marinobacterium jannaschii]
MGHYSFKLPDLGEGIVESEVVDWYVSVGDTVEEDQHIADVMTDKATVELSAPVSGVIRNVGCEAGAMLAVGAELVLIETEGEGNAPEPTAQPAKAEPAVPAQPAAVAEPEPEIMAPVQKTTISHVPGRHEVLAAPSVRRRAREEDIDLGVVPGTGPAGRITNSDLDNFIAAGGMQAALPVSNLRAARSATTEVPIRGLRRMIAQKMVQSKRNIPHYSYIEEVDVSALEELRQHLNQNRKPHQPKLTLLPFIMQALTKVLPEFPFCNARYDDEREVLTQYEAVHIGIATMTEKGLMVPVVKHGESLDIWQSAAELSRIADAARDGSAKADELTGSTITITSLGAIGGIASTPVINAPETSIIGVNKLQERPVVHNGEIVVRKMMNLSSSFDHRVVDGYDAALMVQALKRLLENPASIFV